MLRNYIALQERINTFRSHAAAEDGTTVPEYMLVLGFISLIVVVAFSTTGVEDAIIAMGTDLAAKIAP